MPNALRGGNALPPPQPGYFGAANFHSYMWGFWLGLAGGIVGFIKSDTEPGGRGLFQAAIGVQSTSWAYFWAFILFYVVASMPVGRASLEYFRFTGRDFVEDRIGFARAGGQDIGFFSGLLSVVSLSVLVYWLMPSAVGAWVRIPLVVVPSAVIGNRIATNLSRRAYSVLFGVPREQ